MKNNEKIIVSAGVCIVLLTISYFYLNNADKKDEGIGDRYVSGSAKIISKLASELDSKRAAELYLKTIELAPEGIIIEVREDIRNMSPIFLNEHFQGNRLHIPSDADLNQYRLVKNDVIDEQGLAKSGWAFVVAFPLSKGQINKASDYTYRALYVHKIKDGTAYIGVSDVFKSAKNTGFIWSNFKSYRVNKK